MKQSGVPVYRDVRDLAAIGEAAVERVRFTSGGESHELPAASLLLHEGVVPNPQLTRLIGCDHRWNAAQRCFHPVLDPWGESSVPGIFVAGDGGGIAGAEAAAAAGHLAGLAIAGRTGTMSEAERDLKATGPGDRLLAARAVRPMLDAMYPPPAWIAALDGDIAVCRCEEVSARAVRGAAAGVGASLAMSGDIITCGRSAYFLEAFARIGLVPDGGAAWFLTRSVGRVRAMELMMLAEKLPAEKAFEWGLITRLFEDDAVEAEAMKIAQKLADGPTRALALTRQSAWAAADSSFTETLQLERVLQRDAGNHPDFAEGVAAFMEKRAARFGG